jgi:hypothetical protein
MQSSLNTMTGITNTDKPVEKKPTNNIREIRSLRQLEKSNLDFESPRMKQAMNDLGISKEECVKK